MCGCGSGPSSGEESVFESECESSDEDEWGGKGCRCAVSVACLDRNEDVISLWTVARVTWYLPERNDERGGKQCAMEWRTINSPIDK